MSILWNTSESEWGVLIQAASAPYVNKSRDRSESQPAHLYALQHTDGFFFFQSKNRNIQKIYHIKQWCLLLLLLLLGWMMKIFFLCFSWTVHPLAVKKTTRRHVTALSYRHDPIPVGHELNVRRWKVGCFIFFCLQYLCLMRSSHFIYIVLYIKKKKKI